jgi:hypothetical protein
MILLIGVYFLPTVVALILRVRGSGWVFAANLIAGWTLIGWLAALWLVFVYRGLDRLEHSLSTAYAVRQSNED